MTKCIDARYGVGGDRNNRKRIVFECYLMGEYGVSTIDIAKPKAFDFIELIAKNYSGDLDLMYAYDKGRRDTTAATAYLGHWNNGVV